MEGGSMWSQLGGCLALAVVVLAIEAVVLGRLADYRKPSSWGGDGGRTEEGIIAAGGEGGGGGVIGSMKRWVQDHQETQILWQRYREVRHEFEGYLQEREALERPQGWAVLTTSRDNRLKVSIRWPEPSQPGKGVPLMIAEGLFKNRTADALWEAMRVGSTHKTMPRLDPFYESYTPLHVYNHQIEIGRRTTKRLLVYGKRDFIFASFEEKEAAAAATDKKAKGSQKRQGGREGGREGEQLHVTASISLSLEGTQQIGGRHTFLPPSFPPSGLGEREGYTRAHQDLVGFYFPCPEDAFATRATIIMRTDLKGNIPHWVFSKSVGTTGMHFLQTLEDITKATGKRK